MANLVGTDVADSLLLGSEASDTVSGLGGDDVIIALDGDDLVLGDQGNDDVNGNRGNDTVRGGPGDDIFVRGGREKAVKGFSRLSNRGQSHLEPAELCRLPGAPAGGKTIFNATHRWSADATDGATVWPVVRAVASTCAAQASW